MVRGIKVSFSKKGESACPALTFIRK